jgi:hypothetical protein
MNNFDILLPCAGLSSRFPNMRPKYLLTCPNGNLVLQEAIKSIKNFESHNIYIAILKDHQDKYDCIDIINKIFPNFKINITVIDKLTRGPAETVYRIIKDNNIDNGIMIKDADSFFEPTEFEDNNFIGLLDLRKNPSIENVGAKSFSIVNENQIITNIVEKNIVSNYISGGIYGFKNSLDYKRAFLEIESNNKNEIYISHVADNLINKKEIFKANILSSLIDVGTLNDWKKYVDYYKVLFVDIDGVIVENQSKYIKPIWGDETKPLLDNINILIEIQKNGGQIIFTTSRPEIIRNETIKMLTNLGFIVKNLIMGLNHGKRYLINDYSNSSNPYPTAIAINIKRNSQDLKDYLV